MEVRTSKVTSKEIRQHICRVELQSLPNLIVKKKRWKISKTIEVGLMVWVSFATKGNKQDGKRIVEL
jgi:hypothetical protein